MGLETFYKKMNYKFLMLIPIIIFLIAGIILVENKTSTGEWIDKGIELKGGTQLTIHGDYDKNIIEQHFSDEVSIREINSLNGRGIVIESEMSQSEVLASLKEIEISTEDFSFRSVGPSLGEASLQKGIIAMIFAFLFMSFVVFIIFKKLLPSVNVIIGAVADLVGTLALMNIFEIQLSSVTFAGLLLVIGYSIDTDILLTTKILKRDGSIYERSVSAMKTGMLMTVTTLAALIVLYLLSGSAALQDIALVLMFALLIDIPTTWLFNLGLLRWWKEK